MQIKTFPRIILSGLILFAWLTGAAADDEALFSSSTSVQPNVLMILDNSNSMDEDFLGNCVCSWATGSRSVEGRRALIDLVNTYANSMRIGLMTYRLSTSSSTGASKNYYLHNSLYFATYQEKAYCPSPPAECEEYCRTGDSTAQATCQTSCVAQNSAFDATYRDEIITNYAVGTEQRNRYCNLVYPKTNRVTNLSDTSNYVYYKLPGTFYSGSNYGRDFCYSSYYSGSESSSDNYDCYNNKTGTSDSLSGYSSASLAGRFDPTDEDIALGFRDFGRRMAWTYSGLTWFASASPGNGYLHVGVAANNSANDNQKNALLAKLAMNEGSETGYMACTKSDANSCAYVVNAGLTPTAGTFRSAYNYFKGEKDYLSSTSNTSPLQDWCQKNFVVYVTDGLPSVGETGTAGTAATLLAGVNTRIDNLRALSKTIGSATYTFDIQTYILGMALTDDAKPYLNSMAVHGGTDVNGQAYYASNSSELVTALNTVFSSIIERAYSFSTASVSSSRIQDENYIYETSFEPVNDDPFWKGYIRKYAINTDGSIGNVAWEAGSEFYKRTTNRNIYTSLSGSTTEFTTANITMTHLGTATEAAADAIVNYIRGDSTPDNWKLGDTFHSNPITIGSPSAFFYDTIGNAAAFTTFRTDNQRTSANGKRLLITGANDGQLHAFLTSTGSETWSFIPPNLLPKLQYLAHSAHSTSLVHSYFVDGPITVSDVWLGTGTKTAAGWATLAVVSLGRNDRDYTNATPGTTATKFWSSSSYCNSDLSHMYSVTATNTDGTTTTITYPYYCGYYAFDFTNSLSPTYKWHINFSDTANQAPYLGEPWSRMVMGRVKIAGAEKWVGFIGAGYSGADCYGSTTCSELRGKGFYVVELSTGNILWKYTNADNVSNMQYDIAAAPAAADIDSDGYIDTVFVGDTGGNMWRFNLCRSTDTSSCGTSSWTGVLLLDKVGGSDKQPIYTSATISKDNAGQVWVYWGTGDKTDPTGTAPAGYFWAVKPELCVSGGSYSPCTRSSLENLTSSSSTYSDSATKKGWYINLAGTSEKILSDPVVFGGAIYYTTYTPSTSSASSCNAAGTAKLYALTLSGGGGILDPTTSTTRGVEIGGGIASAPVISLKPGSAASPDLYVTISGGGGQNANTLRVNFNPPTLTNRSNILFWRDRRL